MDATETVNRWAREAKRIMGEKGSYDVAVDPRIQREYERAYEFIQRLSYSEAQATLPTVPPAKETQP